MASSIIPSYDPSTLRSTRSIQLGGDLDRAAGQGVFSSLAESVRDLVMPPKYAPLELASKPVYSGNRMQTKTDPKATGIAIAINGTAVLLFAFFGTHAIHKTLPAVIPEHTTVSLVAPLPPPPLPKAPIKTVTMAGGGGHPMPVSVSRGNPPVMAPKPVQLITTNPPKIAPRLAVAPSINVQPDLKLAKTSMPTMGMPTAAPAVAVSLGNGSGAGIGAGAGSGLGNGTGGNYGGGVFKVGGGVTAPAVVSAPEPQFTEEARQAKASGKVVVYLQVSPEGRPMHVRVVRGLGMGLDEKAIEAVRQYKFKPAMKDGHPVTVEMNVDVNFQIL